MNALCHQKQVNFISNMISLCVLSIVTEQNVKWRCNYPTRLMQHFNPPCLLDIFHQLIQVLKQKKESRIKSDCIVYSIKIGPCQIRMEWPQNSCLKRQSIYFCLDAIIYDQMAITEVTYWYQLYIMFQTFFQQSTKPTSKTVQ